MRRVVVNLLKLYQRSNHQPHCKFKPTCSTYALEVFQRFGFFYATLLTIWRVLRCNPFNSGGYDPAPLSRVEKNIILASCQKKGDKNEKL